MIKRYKVAINKRKRYKLSISVEGSSLAINRIQMKITIVSYLTHLRNLYAGQEATVRTGHGTTDWFQMEKEYVKAVYCHPAYLTSMQSTS